MPIVSAGDARVDYQVHGSGDGVLFVHGTGFGAAGTWGHLVDQFTDDRTVLLPDLAGCGATEYDGGELTVEQLAAQIIGVIEDAGKGPVDLVGFSLGAVVSAAVAATRPDLVSRLVLTAGWAGPGDAYLNNHMTVWRSLSGDADAFGRFGTLTAFSPDFLNGVGHEPLEGIIAGNQPTEGALRHIDLNLRADIRELLPKIEAETLVIGCTLDSTVPVANARELAAGIARSSYSEIKSGHVVVYENPTDFVKLVKDFIRKA
ncbi:MULTISPECIES: alpha/beta fold hydrolase [unclassified Streptomyces]|uniref:alpha/beta fold hydrolase n=1 Tax=unclassified Streptomyces TaxID=2593676 RepID=UPI000DAF2F2B|nr:MULTISPECIES: alpha/beta hydrolase [unclassified Streptomyces]PZT74845.1 alpha/beta hydrolase [Streptomyces sp. AC1-42T]PZT82171.1 alpha/beta hydrolase [Streptomyces sp. AC1-42W]